MHYSHSPPEHLLLQALRAITSHPFALRSKTDSAASL